MGDAEPSPPTLDSIPQLDYCSPQEELEKLVRSMQATRFHTWGFVIYRCTYSDDEAWQRYMDRMKEAIRRSLDEHGRLELLLQYLDLVVIEDRSLEGATKATVRSRFKQWAGQRSVDRDGRGADYDLVGEHPRFTHCLYVDQKCLDTLAAYDAWRAAGQNWHDSANDGMSMFVVCAIIDMHCRPSGRGPQGFPNIEGCVRKYTGWMYMSIDVIVSLYDDFCGEGLGLGEGFSEYIRPPLVYPANFPSSSIVA